MSRSSRRSRRLTGRFALGLGGTHRAGEGLSDGVHDKGFDSGGLQPGKGSLLIRFNLTLTPDTTNVSISKDNFSLTLPDGRVIRPDHAPILVSPNQSSYQSLIIATQVDTPAAGTYKLTFKCGVLNGYGQPGQPVTIPFTVYASP